MQWQVKTFFLLTMEKAVSLPSSLQIKLVKQTQNDFWFSFITV